jgi:hypothetical protein
MKKTSQKIPSQENNQKYSIKMVKVKTTWLKWQFGQVGQGAKKPYGGVFRPKFLIKKAMISYNDF